jgi:hypothetical protein
MSKRRLEQFEILKRFFNNVDDAFLWILSESLDRNNISDEQFERNVYLVLNNYLENIPNIAVLINFEKYGLKKFEW